MKPVCRGLCAGERGAADSPAELRRSGERLIVWCPCCDAPLRHLPPEYNRVGDALVPAHQPNINPALAANTMRFTDDQCGYDHVLITAITERQ